MSAAEPTVVDIRCFMGAPLGDEHRCRHVATVPTSVPWVAWCETCAADEACTCDGCTLPYTEELT